MCSPSNRAAPSSGVSARIENPITFSARRTESQVYQGIVRIVSPWRIREACARPDPAPPISPGPPASSPASSMTARRLSVEAPAFRNGRGRASRGPARTPALPGEARAGTGRRSRTRPRPELPERPRPGSPPAPHPANPAIANPAIPDPGAHAGAPPRPVIPKRPDRPRLGRPPAPHPANPAIPDPGTAPARDPARLSRNARNAPVPEARPPRIPQIPQLRIPQSRIREPRRPAAPPGYPGTPGAPTSRKPARPAPRAGWDGFPAMPAARRAGEGAGDGWTAALAAGRVRSTRRYPQERTRRRQAGRTFVRR